MLRHITAGDRKVMYRVNRWKPPLWIRHWMVGASRAGDGWGWALAILAVAIGGGEKRFAALEAALIALGAGQILFNVVKRVTGRARPCATAVHSWATLLPPDRFSFPSGHTITAFTVAVPLGLSYHDLMAPLIFCALSVACSRVVLGLHYLSDVIAGIAIGSAVGFAAFRLV